MPMFVTPKFGLKNLPAVSQELKLKNETQFPYAGIWLFTGAQGSGKTLLMMHCLKHLCTLGLIIFAIKEIIGLIKEVFGGD